MKKKKEDIFTIIHDKEKKQNHILSIFKSKSPPLFDIFNIYLYYSYQKIYYKFNLRARIVENKTRIILNDIIEALKTYSNIKLKNHSLSYYIPENNNNKNITNNNNFNYFYLGKFPFYKENTNLLIENPKNKTIFIKLRPIIDKTHLLRFEIFEDENDINNKTENDDETKTNYYINKNSKRAKERKINEIILKVYLWKKIYNYCVDKYGEKVKLTLQEAASLINLSKKSLDEYLNQIKFGKEYGFDFNKHKNCKVGLLRGFVKKMNKITNEKNNNENGRIKVIKKIKKNKNENENENEFNNNFNFNLNFNGNNNSFNFNENNNNVFNNSNENYELQIISKDKNYLAKKVKRNLSKK